MVAAYLESIKYIGHLWPIALMRVFIGTLYAQLALGRLNEGYLDHPFLSEKMQIAGESFVAGGMYFEMLKSTIQNNWYLASAILIGCELLISGAYFIGFGVRVVGLLAMLLSIHSYLFFGAVGGESQFYLFYIHLMFVLMGAGRCLGLDYYFYKSRRGILW